MFNFRIACLCTASFTAMTVAAQAQTGDAPQQPSETVVVTGSRVITDIANSPTPVTTVSTSQLTATTPENVTTALEKLPVFMGSTGAMAGGKGTGAVSEDNLNLRDFGTNRNLVLFDGHRVLATAANGAVNVGMLPEMLVSRVDVVTGGASAVYGSDAVTGVINYILDKNFTGIKYEANAGISQSGLGAQFQLGIAAGDDLFGGRGHIEGNVRYQHMDHVEETQLPYDKNGAAWGYAGAGTTAAPYFLINDARRADNPPGGLIGCGVGQLSTGAGCALQGETFIQNGVPGPYNPGIVESATLSDGGDGHHDLFQDYFPKSSTLQDYERFSYNVSDDAVASVEVRASQGSYYAVGPNNSLAPGTGESARPNTFAVANPYLSPAIQAQLASGNPGCPGGVAAPISVAPNCLFNFTNSMSTLNMSDQNPGVLATYPLWTGYTVDRDLAATADLTGEFAGRWDWDVYYTHEETREKSSSPSATNNQLLYAAEDAVQVNGNAVCYVSTTAYASLYPNCVPVNPFGPSSITGTQYNYFSVHTKAVTTNIMDNVGGSLSGNIFDLPAGPVKAALSAESRWLSYGVVSNAQPGFVNCTGLRLCSTYSPLWAFGSKASLTPQSENVTEVAGEIGIPVLKDAPLAQELSLDLAGRYTDYSISGEVETWKIGFDWHVDDALKFRGTTSVDIRAPTLNDLFQPATVSQGSSLNDKLTGKSSDVLSITQGNPSLTAEVAHTYTVGTVLTPAWFPNFTATLDYYRINLYNAITAIAYTNSAVQTICIASGGTSPYCSLASRPYPLTNTTAANFPTSLKSESLNSATQKTEGVDFEMDYNFDLQDAVGVPGAVSLRNLFSYQPYITQIAFPGAPPIWTAMPKSRDTLFVGYVNGNWDVELQNHWLGGYDQNTTTGQVFLTEQDRHIPNFDQVDITINKKFQVSDSEVTGFLSVQDIANVLYPVATPDLTTGASNPGSYPAPTWAGAAVMGRYFTVGIRGEL